MDCSPFRLLCPWDSPGKNTAVGCHFLLQGIFPTQGSNPHCLCLLHCRQIDSLPAEPWEKPGFTFGSENSQNSVRLSPSFLLQVGYWWLMLNSWEKEIGCSGFKNKNPYCSTNGISFVTFILISLPSSDPNEIFKYVAAISWSKWK